MSTRNEGQLVLKPIGVIHTPYKEMKGTPIQPPSSPDVEGTAELFNQYIDGLKDLDGFSHIILLYHFNLSKDYSLTVKPYLDDELRGVFATRAPKRPNPLGLSIVELIRIEKNRLFLRGVDMIDGTPLLDIKPYVPKFDHRQNSRIGWLTSKIHMTPKKRDDGRFDK